MHFRRAALVGALALSLPPPPAACSRCRTAPVVLLSSPTYILCTRGAGAAGGPQQGAPGSATKRGKQRKEGAEGEDGAAAGCGGEQQGAGWEFPTAEEDQRQRAACKVGAGCLGRAVRSARVCALFPVCV